MSGRPEDRAATFDELLGSDFETPAASGSDSRLAERRLAAWCATSADGDWGLFDRRLARDGWDRDDVRARLAGACRLSPSPAWARDAQWIASVLGRRDPVRSTGSFPFEHVFDGIVDAAEARLPHVDGLTSAARHDLRNLLSADLTALCAPALYQLFRDSTISYAEFVAGVDMKQLLDDKPVLLRLIAALTRQWIDATGEFLQRWTRDDAVVRRLAGADPGSPVVRMVGGLSDRHLGGRSVLELEFSGGCRVLYKPKDLRVDAAWHDLVEWLNGQQGTPAELRAVRAVSRAGYGWTEFVVHSGCADEPGVARFFRRAGAWLALLHSFGAADMHHENVIASGEHPVPVDLEAILQVPPTVDRHEAGLTAHDTAKALIAESVLAVGLLPGYARSADRRLHAAGGFAAGWTRGYEMRWCEINSDNMRPDRVAGVTVASNLPHVDGCHVGLGEYLDEFLAGFTDYARFLLTRDWTGVLETFNEVVVRTVHRPTQFYHLLLDRLRDDRMMDDGVTWSSQADFLARLADWGVDNDPGWALQRSERDALVELNIPVFHSAASAGLRRVRGRLDGLDDLEIAWQCDAIRHTSSFLAEPDRPLAAVAGPTPMTDREVAAEADAIADEISRHAVRRGPDAAWIGLNWFPESDAAQLAVLGHDLYNGNCGIAVFLAAHARARSCPESADLALAALARLRRELNGHNAARLARLLGVGGATGLGSVVYALAVTASLLADESLLADAERAAELLSDGLIAADTQFDVVGGSAGAVLGLLRLYASTRSPQTLDRAVKCGERLLARTPAASGVLSGMSHGAVGLAYALSALGAQTGCRRYLAAATEWVEYGRNRHDADEYRRSQWCHGAVGVGLARWGMAEPAAASAGVVAADVDRALKAADLAWPAHVDTLCCGSLGIVEFFWQCGRESAARECLSAVIRAKESAGAYRWNGGATRFNLGLFRGLAGVGYTCLRGIDPSLPNLLVWG